MSRSVPGGVKSPPADPEDTGFIPVWEDPPTSGGWAHVPTTGEPVLQSQGTTITLKPLTRESPGSNHDPAQPKIKK